MQRSRIHKQDLIGRTIYMAESSVGFKRNKGKYFQRNRS